jgi:hypothetical protein
MYRYSNSTTQTAFRSHTPITNAQIAHHAPSVLAAEAHASRGDRYAFIPTIEVIDGLRKEGFHPFEVRQTKCRDLAKREHTKHLVRLRHESLPLTTGGGEVPELVLLNSHDGSSSYQLIAGFFRMVCSNGLIAGDVTNDIRIRHSGRVIDDVIEGSYQVLENITELGHRIDDYKAIELQPDEQRVFADSALQLRWADQAPVTAASVLEPRRWDDTGRDLWSVFNRVQENLVQGGVRGRAQTGRRLTTRGVGGVTENVKLNRSLWTLADGLAQVKQAA